ncbi:GSK3B-interacting protein-like [Haliotis cracherodii]|uniref:GSK3B-interacting protein-like n=1 Tax=Haliotis cracherodii TaxID=6455 RepID=UPI001EAFFE6C
MADSPVCNEDHILKIEAQEAVREVAFAVKSVEMSKSLPVTAELVYLNLRTKEDVLYCVELSISGFRIVGKSFDTVMEDEPSRYYETIYQLLDTVSPEYRNTFGDTLAMRLKELQEKGDDS